MFDVHLRTKTSATLRIGLTVLLGTTGLIAGGQRAVAGVTRFEILSREPFAGGTEFGDVGAYERIVGRVYFAVDPALTQNKTIVDLDLAPRNDEGLVEFYSDLDLLTPVDRTRGNGAILYDVNNRGNKLALRFFNFGGGGNNPRLPRDAGDGLLMREGFTIVWSGWDGELVPGGGRLRLSPPVIKRPGNPLTGLVRCEIVPESRVERMVVNWANHGSYRPTQKGLAEATLTQRILPHDDRQPVPRDRWRIHVSEVESDSPTQLPLVELEIEGGFQRGHIYELIYEAQDPLVHGVCFASVRDLVSAFRHGGGDGNPLADGRRPVIPRAHAFGVSQSGRFLREFVYSGFNEDEMGRKVFDGVIPHVSGSGLGSFNHRFAQPTRHATQHDHFDYPPDRFPFAYGEQHDPRSGRTDGILRRSLASGTAPYIMHTQSAAEYWTRSGSLTHTDPMGRYDADIPPNVRIYSFGGTQHGPASYPPTNGKGKYAANPGDYRPMLRALLMALDRWSRDGTPPPASRYPTIARGTLVHWSQPATGFPEIEGVAFPKVIRQPAFLDLGRRWYDAGIIDRQPPGWLGEYRVRVPRCDEDGNELDCLSPPEVAVPIATYTGWNLRRDEAGAEDELVSLQGSYLPFPVTAQQRAEQSDPRASLEERYGSLENYLQRLEAECRRMSDAGYLLAEDVERTMRVQSERLKPIFSGLE